MSDVKIGSVVFTESGNKAIYAGEIDGQKFVRIMLQTEDPEEGIDEWPSDKLTPVSRVFASEPAPVVGPMILQLDERISKARQEEVALRTSIEKLRADERVLKAACAKHPEIATALDFLEDRISHVVIEEYGEIKVVPLQVALSDYEMSYGRRTDNGLKLLCLFGHKKGEAPRWAINRYHDGSGSYTTVTPFRSEAEAVSEVQRRADAAFAAWREGGKDYCLDRFGKAGVTPPQDYLDHRAAVKAKAVAEKVAKLRAEIEALVTA